MPRTTLHIDDELLKRAAARYPAGMSKTALIAEALRQLAEAPLISQAPRRLGAFAHIPLGIHDNFDAPLAEDELAKWEGG